MVRVLNFGFCFRCSWFLCCTILNSVLSYPGVGTKKIGRNPEPTGTHIFEIRGGSTRNPGTNRGRQAETKAILA